MPGQSIKFVPDRETREGLEKIAAHYRLGSQGDSANEVMKTVASVFGRVQPAKFFQAIASVETQFCTHKPAKFRVRKRSVLDQT